MLKEKCFLFYFKDLYTKYILLNKYIILNIILSFEILTKFREPYHLNYWETKLTNPRNVIIHCSSVISFNAMCQTIMK